jgi:hypothetical protein
MMNFDLLRFPSCKVLGNGKLEEGPRKRRSMGRDVDTDAAAK